MPAGCLLGTISLMMQGGPPTTAERPVERRWRAVVVPLAVLAFFCVCLAVLLVFSPLNETPDTYCQTVTRPPAGEGCSPVTARRWRWIWWVLALAAVLAVSAWLARRRHGGRRFTRVRGAALVLMLAAVVLGSVSAAFLTIGKNHDMCGSTLSRVDEHGLYSPDRPKDCAPSYASSRADAWVFGLFALAVFAAGAMLEGRAAEDVAAPRD